MFLIEYFFKVSADYDEVHILAADPIQGVNISTTALVDNKYVPRNESTRFEAVLFTGENVTLTTAGSESVIFSDWAISIDGVVEQTYNGISASCGAPRGHVIRHSLFYRFCCHLSFFPTSGRLHCRSQYHQWCQCQRK